MLFVVHDNKETSHKISPNITSGWYSVGSYGCANYDEYQSSTSSLSELIATLCTSPVGWTKYNLTTPVPSPESLIGSEVDSALLDPLMAAYNEERTKVSAPLARAVMLDVDAYDAAADKHEHIGGPAVMKQLEAAAKKEASASMKYTEDKIAAMTKDPNAPDSTSLAYVPYAQRIAADVSIAVYFLICTMIAAVGVGGYCIPGGVKGASRFLFKTMFKYGGQLGLCHDLSRVTIKVPNLKVMAELIEALHKHPDLHIIRCKNRFDANANTSDSGGYRDYQTMCLFKLDGRYHYVEVQFNLVEMVAIKAGGEGEGEGGHDAFNTARVIDAFSKRSIEYRGNPTQELYANIAAGSLLRVVLDGATFTNDDGIQLAKALASKQSRVKHLSTKKIKVDRGVTAISESLLTFVGGGGDGELVNLHELDLNKCRKLAELPEGISKFVNLQELNLENCDKLTELPKWISKLVNLQALNLRYCKKLAEPLPDLSHLLPELTVNIGLASDATIAWEERGFRSVAGHAAFLKDGPSSPATTTFVNLSYYEGSQLPEWLNKLANLQELDLHKCRKLAELPEWISKLVNLQTLNLRYCDMLAELPEGISKLVNLQELNLENCDKLTELPKWISKLVNLQALNLRYCKKLAEPLPDLSHLLPALTVETDQHDRTANAWKLRGLLSVENYSAFLKDGPSSPATTTTLDFSYYEGSQLPEWLSKLVNLQELNLYWCDKLTELPEWISKLVNLQELNLEDCDKLTKLPEGLGKLVNLKTLNLHSCDELAEPLPDLSHLLPALTVKTNFGTGKAASTWATRGLTSLAQLALASTLATEAIAAGHAFLKDGPSSPVLTPATTTTLVFSSYYGSQLPDGISKFVNLQTLKLENCSKLTELPAEISKLVNLQTLKLENCSKLTELPEGISKLVNLQTLKLENCSKLTELPEGISKLVNLQELNLYWCDKLTELPEWISKLVNLQTLKLDGCSKLTMLPEGLGKLVNLQLLDLDDGGVLAEPLPDLSHLLPALTIASRLGNSFVSAWRSRGFTAVSP